MKIYITDRTDPYFNLASEQYLLDTENDEVFMLWRNEKAVIIGRNQNAYAEINKPFVDEHGIKVVRRLTGGGAVFHDLGNVNFTYIVPRNDCPTLDFERFSRPVINALRGLGVEAELSGRNDITVGGRKISGNAQCVYNNKVMHHGTLLFSADMSQMAGALNVDEEKIKSKGIKSVRARVCNLSEYLPDMDVTEFKSYLENCVEGEKTVFSPEQIKGIEKLRDEKYSTWERDYGVSKEYDRRSKKYFPYGTVDISLSADGGVITAIRFFGDYFGVNDISEIENRLIGSRLERADLEPRLYDIGRYIMGAAAEDIIGLIMG